MKIVEVKQITAEQIRKARAYDSLENDLKGVKNPGEPVRECVLRIKHEWLHLWSMEAMRAWTAERDARVGTNCIGSVPATYQPEASP